MIAIHMESASVQTLTVTAQLVIPSKFVFLSRFRSKMIKFNCILPDTARIVPDIEDYILANANEFIGMSFTNVGWAKFVGKKFGVTHLDVFRTIEYMIKMEYLIPSGVFGTVQLWEVDPEMVLPNSNGGKNEDS